MLERTQLRRVRRSWLLLAIVVSFLAWSVWRAGGARAQSTITSPWIVYTVGDGLVSNNVFAILPGDGEVWFGADGGISRFNGAWQSWSSGEAFQGGVTSFAAGEEPGTLWAGADSGAVLRWNAAEETWEAIDQVSGSINALHFANGQLWIGADTGLYVWNGSEMIGVEALSGITVNTVGSQANTMWVGTSQGLWVRQRNVWSVTTAEDGLPGTDVTALWVDPSGPVWVAVDGAIAWREPTTGAWTEVSTETLQVPSRVRIQALTGDANGEVWGGTNGNGPFHILDRETLISLSGDLGLTTPFIQAVAIDQDGSVWYGTVSGVFRSDREMWAKEFRGPVTIPGLNFINALLVDRQDRLWIATRGAGVRLKEDSETIEPEVIYDESAGLPSNFVNDIGEDQEGNIWAATLSGVARYDPEADGWTQPIALGQLPSALATAILAERENLWIGTDQGLARYDRAGKAVTIIEALAGRSVEDLAVDSLHRLWVSTQNSGVFVQESQGGWTHYTHDPQDDGSILGNSVVALAADPNVSGGMWIGVDRKGINYWDGSRWADLTETVEVPSKVLYDLYADPMDASLWIGSEGGVTHYDGLTSETLINESVLPAASIFTIVRNPNGVYWFGGKDGLTSFRPERTPPWIRIKHLSGAAPISDALWQLEAGQQTVISFVAGDLYTPQSDLKVLYRIDVPGQIGDWTGLDQPFLELPGFEKEGNYKVEFLARDLAFNYSDVVGVGLQIVPPPASVDLPFLGPVRRDYFLALVVTGMIALIGFGYMSIEIAQNRRRTREAVTRGYNPFISGEPVRRQDMFFGRDDTLQQIVDTLHNNSIMIHGERRIGKTSLLYQLAGHLRGVDDPEYWFIPLYIDLEGTTEDIFFHFLMEEILQGVLTLPHANEEFHDQFQELLYHRTATETYTDREFSRDLRRLIRALQGYCELYHPHKQLRLILLMDEMDVMSEYNRIVQQRLRRIFMRDFAATLGAVVAGIKISKEWDRIESPWYNLFNEIELKPFPREQALQLLTEPIQDYYRYDPAALEFIVEHSNGRPYRLQQYALEAVNHMLADSRRTITLDDAEFAHHHIQNIDNDVHIGLDSEYRKRREMSKDESNDSIERTKEEFVGRPK